MSLFTQYQEFKKQLANPTVFRSVDNFWEAWHKFTGDKTSHPYEVYEFALEDDIISGENELRARNERAYQHRANGRPQSRFR